MHATYFTHVILRDYRGSWKCLRFEKCYQNDQIEDNKIGRAGSIHERYEKWIHILSEIIKERDYLEDMA
jgi:hypothetical protein